MIFYRLTGVNMVFIESVSKNEIVFGWGEYDKTVFDVLRNALSERNNLILPKNTKAYVHTTSGYGDLKVEIKKGMTYDELHDDFIAASKEYLAKREKEREGWFDARYGIVYTQAEMKKKKEHDAFVYHSFDEMVDALKQIKPCDLTSEATSNAAALDLCENVMLVLIKAEDLCFSDEKQNQLSKILKALGCCKDGEVAEKFKQLPEKSPIADMLVAENNIEFPLAVFNNIIDVPSTTFSCGFSKCVQGGKESWCGEWLKTQQKAKSKVSSEKE